MNVGAPDSDIDIVDASIASCEEEILEIGIFFGNDEDFLYVLLRPWRGRIRELVKLKNKARQPTVWSIL